jgi:hypothetical protein
MVIREKSDTRAIPADLLLDLTLAPTGHPDAGGDGAADVDALKRYVRHSVTSTAKVRFRRPLAPLARVWHARVADQRGFTRYNDIHAGP